MVRAWNVPAKKWEDCEPTLHPTNDGSSRTFKDSARACRANGWGRGTVLTAPGEEEAYVIITAVGEQRALCISLTLPDGEFLIDLGCRDWRFVEQWQLPRPVAISGELPPMRQGPVAHSSGVRMWLESEADDEEPE